MGVKKITYFGQELVNHAGATVDASTLAKGVKAWDAKGDLITGTMESGGGEEGGEFDVSSFNNGDGTQTLLIRTAGVPTGGSGLDVGSLEVAVIDKEVEVPERVEAGEVVWVTMQELWDAGVIPTTKTSGALTNEWPNFLMEVKAKNGSFTHSQNQVVYLCATSGGFPLKSNSLNHQICLCHESSASALSSSTEWRTTLDAGSTSNAYGCIGEGYLSRLGGNSIIRSRASAQYAFGIGTYDVRVLLWREKTT